MIAVKQACSDPVLQSNTEQWGVHFAQSSAAVHFCWITAHLYEEQICIGVIACKASCEPVLQNSTGQWEMHFAKTNAAVHWWWVTAHLHEQQSSISVTAVAQACCEPVAEQHWTVGNAFCQNQCCSSLVVGHCTPV